MANHCYHCRKIGWSNESQVCVHCSGQPQPSLLDIPVSSLSTSDAAADTGLLHIHFHIYGPVRVPVRWGGNKSYPVTVTV